MSNNNIWGSSDNMILLSSKTPWYFEKKNIPIPEKFNINIPSDNKIKKNNNIKSNKINFRLSINNSDKTKILLLLFSLILIIIGM